MPLTDLSLTVPEAAFVTGTSVRSVNHEIDEGIVVAPGGAGRQVESPDLIYLRAIRDLRAELGPALRRSLRAAIRQALGDGQRSARVGHLCVALDAVEAELAGPLQTLHHLRAEAIEQRADILSGEPVLAGTRIPARHLADMVRRGAETSELVREFDLTVEQVAAAVLFDRVSPRQGRPPRKARRLVPAA